VLLRTYILQTVCFHTQTVQPVTTKCVTQLIVNPLHPTQRVGKGTECWLLITLHHCQSTLQWCICCLCDTCDWHVWQCV